MLWSKYSTLMKHFHAFNRTWKLAYYWNLIDTGKHPYVKKLDMMRVKKETALIDYKGGWINERKVQTKLIRSLIEVSQEYGQVYRHASGDVVLVDKENKRPIVGLFFGRRLFDGSELDCIVVGRNGFHVFDIKHWHFSQEKRHKLLDEHLPLLIRKTASFAAELRRIHKIRLPILLRKFLFTGRSFQLLDCVIDRAEAAAIIEEHVKQSAATNLDSLYERRFNRLLLDVIVQMPQYDRIKLFDGSWVLGDIIELYFESRRFYPWLKEPRNLLQLLDVKLYQSDTFEFNEPDAPFRIELKRPRFNSLSVFNDNKKLINSLRRVQRNSSNFLSRLSRNEDCLSYSIRRNTEDNTWSPISERQEQFYTFEDSSQHSHEIILVEPKTATVIIRVGGKLYDIPMDDVSSLYFGY